MCVIIVKPAGVAMPSARVLKAAAMVNPDGFGFATPNKYFRSLDVNAFLDRLSKVAASEPCIMHFRLATHGSIRRENCHPFLCDGLMFAHNGILPITPRGDLTDSQTAFEDIIMPLVRENGLTGDSTAYVLNQLAGHSSKFAFLNGTDLSLVGDYYHGKDGCYYSNLRFKYIMN